MSLADIAKAANQNDGLPWQTCAVCHALATIPESEGNALRTLLAGTLRYDQIQSLIAADPDTPLDIDRQALSRHARGQCAARETLRKGAR